jgi:hypothetical protein
LKGGISVKFFSGTLVEADLHYATRIIGQWQVVQPIICVHAIATTRTASAIAFATVWFTAF